jgi:hypothetical protein
MAFEMTSNSGWDMTKSDVKDDCEKEDGISKGLELEKYRMCLGNHRENNLTVSFL